MIHLARAFVVFVEILQLIVGVTVARIELVTATAQIY